MKPVPAPAAKPAPSPPAESLVIDARTATWLLDLPQPATDFFIRGLSSLKPIPRQTVLGKVIAESEFDSGTDRCTAVAILSTPADGVHRLIDVAIRRHAGSAWPTLCCDLTLDLAPDLQPVESVPLRRRA